MRITYALFGVLGVIGHASAFQTPSHIPSSTATTSSRTFFLAPLYAEFVDINERAGRDIGTMDQWATACGVQRAEGFELTSEDGVDWSVMTTQDLPAGIPVLSVPGSMILSSSQAYQEFGQLPAAEDLLNRLMSTSEHFPQFYLFLKVLVEYEKGDQSPWFPWLNSMPRWFDNGAAMTPFCFTCLPPLVAKLASDERVKFNYFTQALKEVDFISEQTKNNKDLTKWAFNVVSTRNFDVYGDKRIVPMADMFNHGTYTEVEISYDEEGNCFAYTTIDVPQGSPLRMSYGDPTNPSYLFATYGFLDESSPATFCKIMDIKPSKELKDIGLDFSRMLFYKDTGGVSQEVWDVLLYDVLESEREVQSEFYQAHMAGDVETTSAIHQQYFLETSRALKNHVDNFLRDLDELSEKTYKMDPNEHPRVPLIAKHNDFVRTTFLTVKNTVDPLVVQATQQRKAEEEAAKAAEQAAGQYY